MGTLQDIPLELVFPNPDQPRKTFDQAQLEELATSIQAGGLIQPIKVTPRDGRFMIVVGERRWRAHHLLGRATIEAIVEDMTDAQIELAALAENGPRAGVHALEEAAAFQRALDRGCSADDLARAMGYQQPWRIKERTDLLRLKPVYQDLFRSGNLGPSQAYELSQLSPTGQDALFAAIRRGDAKSYNALRAASLAIQHEERQTSFLDDPAPSPHERQLAKGLERKIDQVAQMLRASTVDNEVVALKKIDPSRAASVADLLAAMQGDLRRIEHALRAAAPVSLVA